MKRPKLDPRVLVLSLAAATCACAALRCGGDDSSGTPPHGDASVDATQPPPVDGSSPDSIAPGPDANGSDGVAADAGGSIFVPMPGAEPAAVWWDDTRQALFIADDLNNQIWKWTDAGGLVKYATTADPAGALDAGATLVGELVTLSDGTVVVERFGRPKNNTYAAIAYVSPGGDGGVVPGVDPTLHRLGLGVAPGDKLYGSYFAAADGGGQQGAVTTVNLQTGETVFAPGFGKIIGVLVANGNIYVSDQQNSAIYYWPLAGGVPEAGAWPVLTTLPVPDQLSAGPNGSLFTGQFQAAADAASAIAVRQIAADGGVSIFRQDPDVGRPSGLSYDPTHKRLFVADSSTTQNGIHIFPVP